MPEAVTRFRQGLRSGAIHPEKLANMTSEERNKFFESYVGKASAKDVNALFESKLLLKNQKQGMLTWAKSVAGLTEPARRDILSKIDRMNSVLDPEDKKQFLSDLASTKLGVNVTQEEAKTIADMSKGVEAARTAMAEGGNRLAYGRAAVKLGNYVNSLKVHADKLKLGDFKANPAGTTGKVFSRLAGNMKAITASMDNSAIFRQGWKTLWTHPGVWQKNARQSFTNIVKQFGGKEVLDETHAYIISHPNYDEAVKGGLAVTNLEEAFPTSAPEHIPLVGRAYKASEAAYTSFVQKTRMDVFSKYLDIAKKSGVDITDTEELKSIAKMVNSLTGRGSLGKLEPVGNTINNVFFSPRFLKSNIDTLTLHAFDKMTPFARKQAIKNLVKIISGTAAVMAIANAVKPGSVELDPRSSDFGKIKVGDTRFDVTGGENSIATLAARLLTSSSKSTTSGQVTKLNSGKFGSQTDMDVFNNFWENKLSPAAGVARDIAKGQDPNGNKPTVANEAKNSLLPIGIQNFTQTKSDPHGGNALLVSIIDGLGISANTYTATKGNKSPWETSTSKEVQQFKSAVGPAKFKAASGQYNTQLNTFMSGIVKDKGYQKLPVSQQQEVITQEKAKIQSKLFKQNGFKYKQDRTTSKQLKKFLK